ncbi:MAG: NB-ARC domain-containing protein [Agriterribacter sp.]
MNPSLHEYTKKPPFRIFLASSEKLAQIRNEFNKEVTNLNRQLYRHDIFVDLVMWENIDAANHPKGKQQKYNEHLVNCDCLVLVYHNELGIFTKAEYELAMKLFKKNGKPRIYVFEKTTPSDKENVYDTLRVENLRVLKETFRKKGKEQWPFLFSHDIEAIHKFWTDMRFFFDNWLAENNIQLVSGSKSYLSLIRDIMLYGRDEEVRQISAFLADDAIGVITLFGPGGTGKSTLANRVAHANKSRFSNGAIFVELAPVNSRQHIFTAFANKLDYDLKNNLKGKSALDQLIDFLKDKNMIIILDNCEYLVKDCEEIVKEISQRCQGVRLIVTTQIELNVPFNQTVYINPLQKPQHDLSLSEMSENPCVKLFLEYARKADSSSKFKLSEKTRADITEICKLRAGIPLGIILAASAMRVKSLNDIRIELTTKLKSSNEHFKDNYNHHQTIDKVIEWSFNLLTPNQKRIFLKLCVFRDDFSEEAASVIANTNADFERDFQRLVDVSILTKSSSPLLHSKTFFILEPLRHFGILRLNAESDISQVKALFVGYYTKLTYCFFQKFFTQEQETQLIRVEEQYNNVVGALDLAYESNDYDKAGKLCSYLWRYWEVRGQYIDGIQQITKIFESGQPIEGEIYLELLHGQGMLHYRGGDIPLSAKLFDEHLLASDKYRSTQFGQINKAHALNNIANNLSASNPVQSREMFLEALSISDHYKDKRMMAVLQNNIGNLSNFRNDLNEALNYYSSSIRSFEEEKNYWESGFPLYGLGTVHYKLGNIELSKDAFTLAYERRAKVGDKRNMGRCGCHLAIIELKIGNLQSAYLKLNKALEQITQVNDQLSLNEIYLGITQYCYTVGYFEMAIALFYWVSNKSADQLAKIDYLVHECRLMVLDIQTRESAETVTAWRSTLIKPSNIFSAINQFTEKKNFRYE